MERDRKYIKPILIKISAVVVISVSGFLYSRKRTRRSNSSKPSRSSGQGSEGDVGGGRNWLEDDPHVSRKTVNSTSMKSPSADKFEGKCSVKVPVDNSKVSPSPSSGHGGDKDVYLLPEFTGLVKELDFLTIHEGSPTKNVATRMSHLGTPETFQTVDYEHETRHLKDMIRILGERVKNLEVQLLECYGRKEQKAAVMELKNRLKISNMEAEFLILKINSLQADNRRLQEQINDHKTISAELDAATLKIELLKKKLSSEAEQNKEQVSTLQKRVSELQEELVTASNSNIHLHLQKLESLEAEAEELRKSNLKLQLENTELASKLEATQILANSVLEDPETEALRELSEHLRLQNEDLANEIDQLRADRCSDAEELVYLRWLNACLRYELRNFPAPQGKTAAKELSRSLSPKSEKAAKQLILEYASSEDLADKGISVTDFESSRWSPSQTSYITNSGEFDGFSLSSKAHSSHRNKFFKKLRRLIPGKDHCHGLKAEKARRAEDFDSSYDDLSDLSSNRFRNLSLHLPGKSSRHSIDLQRLQTPKSDTGSSYLHRRFLSCDASLDHIDDGLYSTEKSKLKKFAEVLKETNSLTEEMSEEVRII